MSENFKKEPCGVLVVNKHKGVTSHDIVNKIRRLYGTRRVGHTGTLDPLATGVLVVLVGRAAKASEYLVCDSKRYRAVLRLGITSDTEDVTGNILTESEDIPSFEELKNVCDNFVGDIKQIPPMYSALKVGGKKLVDLARAGHTVEREARDITVFSIEVTPTDVKTDYILDVHCSSGTYIRTLCADIGASLGCGGVMAELERCEAGGFRIEEGHTADELEAMSEEERIAKIIPVERIFEHLECIKLPDFFTRLASCGAEIYLSKISVSLPEGTMVRLYSKDGFFALGEVRAFEGGLAIKPVKQFNTGG